MADLTNWIGIDDHPDELTIAVYAGDRAAQRTWQVGTAASPLRNANRRVNLLFHCAQWTHGSPWRTWDRSVDLRFHAHNNQFDQRVRCCLDRRHQRRCCSSPARR
jgi:hypothetical protein